MHPRFRPAGAILIGLVLVAGAPAATGIGGAAPDTASPRPACELLTPPIAKTFAGNDAQRQLWLDSDPPRPLGDDSCFYTGDAGSVFVSINPVPTNPDAPVNHFRVLRPENAVPGVGYQAYWFAAGQSLVVVKAGLLLQVKVTGAQADQEQRDSEIALADVIVPSV